MDRVGTRVYRTNYVTAAELKTLVTPLLTREDRRGQRLDPVRGRHRHQRLRRRRRQVLRRRGAGGPRLRGRAQPDRPVGGRGRRPPVAGVDRGHDPQRETEGRGQVRRQLPVAPPESRTVGLGPRLAGGEHHGLSAERRPEVRLPRQQPRRVHQRPGIGRRHQRGRQSAADGVEQAAGRNPDRRKEGLHQPDRHGNQLVAERRVSRHRHPIAPAAVHLQRRPDPHGGPSRACPTAT